ncbi:hypothetical protein [Corynebacterium nuruki]|jgi:hypothetical protein|uniref:hypothetical protein n=1 Tax=Corynebacterium nuruki TaxID=1032851 RepID=UPI0039BF98C1
MTTAHSNDVTGLDALDPASTPARDATGFRRIIAARKNLDAAKDELQAAVDAARDAGDSWTVIGAALDVSKQAAYQRFGRRRA